MLEKPLAGSFGPTVELPELEEQFHAFDWASWLLEALPSLPHNIWESGQSF